MKIEFLQSNTACNAHPIKYVPLKMLQFIRIREKAVLKLESIINESNFCIAPLKNLKSVTNLLVAKAFSHVEENNIYYIRLLGNAEEENIHL